MEGAESLILVGIMMAVIVGIASICGIFEPDPVEEIEEVDVFPKSLRNHHRRISRRIIRETDDEIIEYIKSCHKQDIFGVYYFRYLLEKEYRGL